MQTEIDISLPNKLFRGDSIDLDCHLNLDLTDYIIRCELFDQFYSQIKLDSTDDEQIEIIDEEDGTFIIHIAKNTTDHFHLISYIEIEIEDGDGKIQTVYFSPLRFEDNIYLRG